MDPKHNAPNQPVTGSSLIPAFGPKNLEKKSGMVDFSLTEVEDPDDDDDYDTFDAHCLLPVVGEVLPQTKK